MRIAVASDDGLSIAGHFGRCAGFEIYEVNGSEAVKIENRPNTNSHHHHEHDHQHGHGQCNHHGHEREESLHSHESFLTALRDCQAVICRGMGRRAVFDLAANGIRPVITTQDITASEAVRLYLLGQLDQSSESQCCSH